MAGPPSQPTESFTAIEPTDWLTEFLNIFQNDTTYGFANRNDDEDDVFRAYSVVQSMPETLGQIPAIWVSCDSFEPNDESDNRPGVIVRGNFMAVIDIYLVCLKTQRTTSSLY
jgi:hypothetical protein